MLWSRINCHWRLRRVVRSTIAVSPFFMKLFWSVTSVLTSRTPFRPLYSTLKLCMIHTHRWWTWYARDISKKWNVGKTSDLVWLIVSIQSSKKLTYPRRILTLCNHAGDEGWKVSLGRGVADQPRRRQRARHSQGYSVSFFPTPRFVKSRTGQSRYCPVHSVRKQNFECSN